MTPNSSAEFRKFISSTQDPDERREYELAFERYQFRKVEALLDELFEECPWMWRIGDGDGGMLHSGLVRRAEKLGLRPPVSKETKPARKPIGSNLAISVFARDSYKCVNCGSTRDLSVDHIQPVSKGGSNDPANLQTLCRPCNSRKGNRVEVDLG